MSTARPQQKWLWLSLAVIVLDQVAKQIAEATLPPHRAVEVLPFFDWYLTYNPGAAFSFLAGAGGWQRWLFAVIAIFISGVILNWLRRLPGDETLTVHRQVQPADDAHLQSHVRPGSQLQVGGAVEGGGAEVDRVPLGGQPQGLEHVVLSAPVEAGPVLDALVLAPSDVLVEEATEPEALQPAPALGGQTCGE